jgi:predicted metalloprotease
MRSSATCLPQQQALLNPLQCVTHDTMTDTTKAASMYAYEHITCNDRQVNMALGVTLGHCSMCDHMSDFIVTACVTEK